MNNSRICPHCNQKISLRRCLIYLLKDSKHSIRCNTCNREIRPVQNPIRNEYCVALGFLSIYIPAMIAKNVYQADFIVAIISSIPFFVIVEMAIIFITLNKLFFK